MRRSRLFTLAGSTSAPELEVGGAPELEAFSDLGAQKGAGTVEGTEDDGRVGADGDGDQDTSFFEVRGDVYFVDEDAVDAGVGEFEADHFGEFGAEGFRDPLGPNLWFHSVLLHPLYPGAG